MSGHSKWSTIKHKKGAKDVQRAKIFAKLARGIEVAARDGGGDVSANAALAQAVAKAKAAEMPNDNVDRAIKRGTGEAGAGHYDEIWYEGYAPGGVAVYVQALTDNRNRAASDIRSTFTRNGGNLGEPGSVAYLFVQRGYLLATGYEDDVMLAALEAGARTFAPARDSTKSSPPPATSARSWRRCRAPASRSSDPEVTRLPTMSIPLDEATARSVLRLIDALEDLDDVQAVYANFDISDEVMAAVAG